MKIDKNINSKRSNWKFDAKVAKNFKSHAEKSIPFYNLSHDIVVSLSEYFVKQNSICYDLGSSQGLLLKKIYSKNKEKKPTLIGIDNSPDMISLAKKNFNKAIYLKKNLNEIKFKKNDFMISLYTIQFVAPKYRQALIDDIYKSLNWGGGFIFFEKIRGTDSRFQDLLTFLYFDFKRANGLNDNQILNKEISLRSVLEPYTISENISFLKRAGFKDIMPVSQYLNFVGFLAIK